MANSVLFLGYERTDTKLIDALESIGCAVTVVTKATDNLSTHDVVVSFGYRHIITAATLRTAARPPVNLHIAYLPYNRGAHPNFWSWIDNTPSGVTIHEIDAGIDTGPIVVQKKVEMPAHGQTFAQSYRTLKKEIENLFIDNIGAIVNGTYQSNPQTGPGTYHNARELPDWLSSWDMRIEEAIDRYHSVT